jgi:hypothetical protein
MGVRRKRMQAAVVATGVVVAAATSCVPQPVRWRATVTVEHDLLPGYRQGVARLTDGSGWIFSTNNGMYRTGEDLGAAVPPVASYEPAIPPELAAQGYDHLGDIDISNGVIWAPLERPDKTLGQQAIARYDAADGRFLDSFPVPQHHAAFVTVARDGMVFSTDYFSDDTLRRYLLRDGSLVPIAPLRMSRRIERIQGGDIAAGAVWLSTDDDHDGLYRVDLFTGEVQDVGSIGHVQSEGEGIDARHGDNGSVLLRATTVQFITVLAVDLRAEPVRG